MHDWVFQKTGVPVTYRGISTPLFRYEKQLQAEEEAYQQARRRLYQEIQDEKERLAQQASRQRQEMDKLQRQLEESHTSSGEVMRREYEKTREEQERRHEVWWILHTIGV